MPDYIPQADAAFQTWAVNFSTYLTANAVALGLLAGDATTVATKLTAYGTALTTHATALAAERAAKTAKDAARQDLETLIRSDVKRIQATPAVTDTQRTSLGITVRDTVHTPAGAPVAQPLLKLDYGMPLEHKISWEQAGTYSRARPAGVAGTQIWRSRPGATVAPASDADWELTAFDTASPHLAAFDSSEVGHRIWYRANYLSTSNLAGPFSATVTAIVTG